jgi:hypothetical protein
MRNYENNDERQEAVYIAYFSDGNCSTPYTAEVSKNNTIALEISEKVLKQYVEHHGLDIKKTKITQIEKLLQEEKAMYKVYFSDEEYSAPYIAEIKGNDTDALEKARYKLKQHIEYNDLDAAKIKIIRIEEINEDTNFIVNLERNQRNERRKNKKPERKNRFIALEKKP